jgi:phenylalanyl-tRNA synthetase alpha chain
MKIDISALHPLEVKALYAFSEGDALSEDALGEKAGLPPENLRTAVQWLLAKELIEVGSEQKYNEISLGQWGETYRKLKVPELRLFSLLGDGEKAMKELSSEFSGYEDKAALGKSVGNLKKVGALQTMSGGVVTLKEGASEKLSSFEALSALLDKVAGEGTIRVDTLSDDEQAVANQYAKKRGKSKSILCLAERAARSYRLVKPEVINELKKAGVTGEEVGQLTPKMLKDGSWKGKNFRRYALQLQPSPPLTGRRHPYRTFLDSTKSKLLSMGFEEMRGSLVENEFWNMDALFMPQFHSARDIHDVYYVDNPSHAKELEEPFGSNVAQTHENGGNTGSQGWGYTFDVERARRLILRSQGTALSARKLAQGAKVPGKYFSIARCFRYDKVDATHLADFYQIEGIVLGNDITFRTLLGLLKLFGREVAEAKEMRFEPAYFPFTEPSVELHARHPKVGWIELGGAGLFRPEVTRPLGVDVPVIAWGLGVDRMAMFALGLNDIRDLFSRDLEFVRRLKMSRRNEKEAK